MLEVLLFQDGGLERKEIIINFWKITCSGTKQCLLYGGVPLEGTGMQHLPAQHQSNSGHMSYQQASSSTVLCWGEIGEVTMFVSNHWDL